ncbi:MAG: ATPase, T2SS/T4P/T4SS family [Candidatus Acidiferrales bacterium]
MKRKRLGDVLRDRGSISAGNLDNALQQHEAKALRLGEYLLDHSMISREDLAAALEEVIRVPYLDCENLQTEKKVLEMIPGSVAARCHAVPVRVDDRKLVVAMAEPQNLHNLNELRFVSGMEISARLSFRRDIKKAIERLYGKSQAEGDFGDLEGAGGAGSIEFITTSSRESNREAMKEMQADLHAQRTPAVRLVSSIIRAATRRKASDIHIDPQAGGLVVRLRVDGILEDLVDVALPLQASLISRIKILADMDIAERRVPQDGRLLVNVNGSKLDLRVATLPTHYGEKVVIRLLNPDATRLTFEDLGFSQKTSQALARILTLPQGMLLVTGPTGSGKTTTLYSALNLLRTRTLNIITVEDPVEYMLEGINQVQVNTKAGRTFAGCLRSMLRQDPNVIMVGEIRDSETAEIALTAAQTGHLVLSTLHTNDSVSALTRLADLNIAPFLIASSVTAVIAQRLLRKLCVCRRQTSLLPEFEGRLLSAGIADFGTSMYIPGGCAACDGTGYKGRMGIYEILYVEEQIRTAVRNNAPEDQVRATARNSGMRMMSEEALEKAQQGLTSLDEVFRVITFEKMASRCPHCNRDLATGFVFCPFCGNDRRDIAEAGDSTFMGDVTSSEAI